MVKAAEPATIYPNYPGAAGSANAPRTVDFQSTGLLPANATTLSGKFAHTYVDKDGSLTPGAGEEVGPSSGTSFVTSCSE